MFPEIYEVVHSIEDETDFNLTPNENNKIKVERMAHDINMSVADLIEARVSDSTRHHFNADVESDLWMAKTKLDALLSELRATKELGER